MIGTDSRDLAEVILLFLGGLGLGKEDLGVFWSFKKGFRLSMSLLLGLLGTCFFVDDLLLLGFVVGGCGACDFLLLRTGILDSFEGEEVFC